MKKIIGLFLLLLFPVSVFGQEWDRGDLYAQSAVLADGETGRVLYEENGAEFRSIASTTKIMTAIIALEQGDPEQVCTVTNYAASMPSVKLGVRSGEQYYLKDLLYAVMLESSNDAAVAVAEAVGGSVEGFAEKMNRKAKELGADCTIFVTPNGLDAPGQGSTAEDLAKIAVYAIKNQQFCDLIQTKNHSFSSFDGKRSFLVSNKNAFLDQMEGAFGIKTGYTGQAGYCFVGAVTQGNRTFVSVVLGSSWPPNKNAKWQDTRKLMEYGFKHFEKKRCLEVSEIKKMVAVKNGVRDFVLVKGTEEYEALVGAWEIPKLSYIEKTCLEAPVRPGESGGLVQLHIGEQIVQVQELKVEDAVKKREGWQVYWNLLWRIFSFQGVL